MRRKPQHAGNISSDFSYMLRFLSHLCNGFHINDKNVARRILGETHLAQLQSVYHTMGQNTIFKNMCLNQAYNRSTWLLAIDLFTTTCQTLESVELG